MELTKTTVEQLNIKDDVKILHNRKGIIHGRIISINETWLDVQLYNNVAGMATRWYKGEILTVRKELIKAVWKYNEKVNLDS